MIAALGRARRKAECTASVMSLGAHCEFCFANSRCSLDVLKRFRQPISRASVACSRFPNDDHDSSLLMDTRCCCTCDWSDRGHRFGSSGHVGRTVFAAGEHGSCHRSFGGCVSHHRRARFRGGGRVGLQRGCSMRHACECHASHQRCCGKRAFGGVTLRSDSALLGLQRGWSLQCSCERDCCHAHRRGQ